MRITCIDQDSCGNGKFILPFPSCVEIGVAFYADNYNTSSTAYGGGIKLSGTAIRVQRAIEEITFDGHMRNNTSLFVELFADASFTTLVDNTTITLVFSSDVVERYWKITNKLTSPPSLDDSLDFTSFSFLKLTSTDLLAPVYSERVAAVVSSSEYGSMALCAVAPEEVNVQPVGESRLSHTYKLTTTVAALDFGDVYRLDIRTPYRQEKQQLTLYTANPKTSPTSGDVDISFTAYGVTQVAAFSVTGLSIAEAADNLASVLNGFSNVGKVDVTHSGPNVAGGDSIFVFGHIFVTFLSNSGSLPLLDVTPRQVNGESGGPM